jgi:hypothetical protein
VLEPEASILRRLYLNNQARFWLFHFLFDLVMFDFCGNFSYELSSLVLPAEAIFSAARFALLI